MKYCQKCGKELFDEAVICVGCGCPVQPIPPQSGNAQQQSYQQPYQGYQQPPQISYHPPYQNQNPYQQTYPPYQQKESNGMIVGGIICGILLPLVGVIMGIVGMNQYKTPEMKNKAKGVIMISAGAWIIWAVIFAVLMQL